MSNIMGIELMFRLQKELDDNILKSKQIRLTKSELLDKKTMAFHVEMAELAQEWRGFKFWSENKSVTSKENLTMEFVDAIHFLISIGIDLDRDIDVKTYIQKTFQYDTIEQQFLTINRYAATPSKIDLYYDYIWEMMLGLAIKLHISEDEIFDSYIKKIKSIVNDKPIIIEGDNMINYGNRGKASEHVIDLANNHYLQNDIAQINKIATPVKVLKQRQGMIVNGFYDKKSTVDYMGVFQSEAVAFDMKSTNIETRFPLSNIHEHQYRFLMNWCHNGGLAFFIFHF